MDKLSINQTIPASAIVIYKDWLDSKGHTAFTGGEAVASTKEGDNFTAWDGYINGKNITLETNKRIVQSWRTAEFDEDVQDSQLEIILEPISDTETKVILNHTNIPSGDQQKYTDGWIEHYFEPMIAYYSK